MRYFQDEMPMTAPVQIESPTPMDHLPGAQDGEQRQVDQMERDAQAKGPLSGLVPGAGGTTTATQAPATTTPSGSGLFGGLPGIPGGGLPGIPGGGLPQGDGQNPTLVLGGFSILLLPMKGMSLSNMASMLSTGQQLGQMLPKPGL